MNYSVTVTTKLEATKNKITNNKLIIIIIISNKI